MVKFGKPEASWEMREEENSCGRAWRRDGSGGRGTRKEEGLQSNERSSTRGPRVDEVLGERIGRR